ncbi:MAG: 5-formyltetrahydrofolate cyclo-ligase [Clostridiales bacterium]|jgi:5-formyltetrahydrofolate cyclo-ligase|nr:5-formyltetrahydrofolate cyclo-ligase [Clostridiales bacterium]
MTKKIRLSNRQIAVLAVMTALMLTLMIVTPIANFFGFIGTAFIVLIIIAAAAVSEGLVVGIIAGSVFGVISFIVSFMLPQPLAPCFQNPLISILPRVFIGVVVYAVHRLVDKLIKNSGSGKKHKILRNGIPAAAGALFNTVAVMGLIALFFGGKNVESGNIITSIDAKLILTVIATNGVAEFVLTLLLTPPIVAALTAARRTGKTTVKADKSAASDAASDKGGLPRANDEDAGAQKTVAERKSELRKEAKERADALTARYRRGADKKIFKKVSAIIKKEKAESVFIYKSFGAEPDTNALIKNLLDNDKKVYVPILGKDGEMEAVPISRDTKYKKNKYDIEEPKKPEKSVEKGVIDVAVIPLLAFDGEKNRLGRGKGCYDRFFSGTKIGKIALAYETQRMERIPSEEWDVKPDIIVTEKAVLGKRLKKR